MSEIKKLSIALVEDDHEIRDVYSFLINKTENRRCDPNCWLNDMDPLPCSKGFGLHCKSYGWLSRPAVIS